MSALFGSAEAAKFRESGEFSDCVQNVREKVTNLKLLHSAKRPMNEFSQKVLRNVGSRKR